MPWHHVVAVLNGSPDSAAATVRAERIARCLGGRCSILQVGDHSGAAPVVNHPIPVPGIPSIEVPRWAEANGADVIVMAGGSQRDALSDGIIRRSGLPCLLIPSWQERVTLLHVALDRTERGLQVLGPAKMAADSLRADVDYVSVAGSGDEGTAAAWLRDRVHVPAPAMTVLTGPPIQALATFMAGSHDGVLVLGVRHGRSGSVPESSGVGRSLLRSAECAFLTVPL